MNKFLSGVFGVVIAFLAWKVIDWALIHAVWQPDSNACRAAQGACWGFIAEKHRFILFGSYPYEQHWRPALASLFLVLLWLLSAWRVFWKWWLVLLWLAGPFVLGPPLCGRVLALPSLPHQPRARPYPPLPLAPSPLPSALPL